MATTILKTKLYIPPLRPDIVSRPRLIEQLDAGLTRKLTLVSAPAGFGKTTLLSEWIHGRGEATSPRHVAWVSLDEGDNDPARFWSYFITALQTIRPDIGKAALQMVQSIQPLPIESILTMIINDLAATSSDRAPQHPCILVLDDYHLITFQPIHDAMMFLLDHLPDTVHLVIATRADPPLHLAKLRGRGQLSELRLSDLRFTPGEVTEFLNRVMCLELQTADVDALEVRTEGWIAGLQMVAVSMQGCENVASFIQSFTGSNRYIMDYLVEEVIQHQPADTQKFLLQTAILDELTGPLCEAILTGEQEHQEYNGDHPRATSGQEVLRELERANLFIVPLDDRREWYRYHHLFSDLLRQRLQHTEPDQVQTLHRRASKWYENNGLMAPAIDHALAAKDFERAVYLLSEHAETLWGRGEQATLFRFAGALPEEYICSSPRLCIFYALMLHMIGRFQEAELHLQLAEQLVNSSADSHNTEHRGMIAAVRANIAYFQGDVPSMIQFSHQALEYLPQDNLVWRCSAAIVSGNAYCFSGDMAAADQAFLEAGRISRMTGNTLLILTTNLQLVVDYIFEGRLQEAVAICQEGLQLASESGLAQTEMAGMLLSMWGWVLCEWNDMDTAIHYMQQGAELSEHGGMVSALAWNYLSLVRLLFSSGDLVAATEKIRQLEKLAQESDVPIWIINLALTWEARILITQGDLEAAAQLLGERGLNVDDDITYLREEEYRSLARLLIAQDRLEEARILLERLLLRAEAEGMVGKAIEILLLRALILKNQEDTPQALASLKYALSLGEPEGYVRIFLDEGKAIATLLRQATAQGIAQIYVNKLLAAFDAEEIKRTSIHLLHPTLTHQLPEPLSEREREVLQLIANGLSNDEIARRLCITPSTAKTHTRNIYSKLGVNSRTQAAAKASTLGILQMS